jgi:hypothetical protein
MWICDGYFTYDFTDYTINPKLVIFSTVGDVNGSFYFSEGLSFVTYNPYHIVSKGSDQATQDKIQIFNCNATISAYLMNEEEYDDYIPDPDDSPTAPPSILSVILYNESETEITFEFTAPAEEYTHLILWSEEYNSVITGNIYWSYTYQRNFMQNYFSLLVVIFLVIILVLFFVFQKQLLPPIVWSLTKLKYYCWTLPWRYVGKGLKWLAGAFVKLWKMMRGIELDEKFEDEDTTKKDDKKVKEEK